MGKLIVLLLITLVKCAEPSNNLEEDERIAHGKQAREGQFPFMVHFTSHLIDNNPLGLAEMPCGGTIYSARVIITSKLCLAFVHPQSQRPMKLYAGRLFRNASQASQQEAEVGRIEYPEKGDYPRGWDRVDLALIITKRPLQFNEFVQPIQILKHKDLKNVKEATVVGYGMLSHNQRHIANYHLQYTQVKQLPANICHQVHPQTGPFYLCFGDSHTARGACFGDTGGPLVVFDHRMNAWKQLGVIADLSCDETNLGLYTDLTQMTSYIQSIARSI